MIDYALKLQELKNQPAHKLNEIGISGNHPKTSYMASIQFMVHSH